MSNNGMRMEEPFEGNDHKTKHRRFLAQDGAFVELRDHRGKIGEIIDVSKGGLAFTVFDVEIPRSLHQGITTIRRHGVQFGKLTKSQKSRLEYFIRHFTKDGASNQKDRKSFPKTAYQ
jgi:hypothetical protein